MSGGEVRYAIVDGWLVEDVGEHTCGTGPSGYYGAHEAGCGLVPMVEIPGAVLTAAREVFTDDGIAIWLTHRNVYLDGCTPLDVISDGDTERVLDYLAALADGAFL